MRIIILTKLHIIVVLIQDDLFIKLVIRYLFLFAVRYSLSNHSCYPLIFPKAQFDYNIIVSEVSSLHFSEISSNKHACSKWTKNTVRSTKKDR